MTSPSLNFLYPTLSTLALPFLLYLAAGRQITSAHCVVIKGTNEHLTFLPSKNIDKN